MALRQNGNAACTPVGPELVAGREVVVKRLCLLVMCLGVPVHAQAQVTLPTNDNPPSFHDAAAIGATVGETPTTATFKAGVDLVALNVVVTDSAEKFVAGLASSDFAVFEDGVQQDVSFFGTNDVPLDLAILLDTSASMSDKLQTAQQAAIGFVSSLRHGDPSASSTSRMRRECSSR